MNHVQKPEKHTCCMQNVSYVRNFISTEEAEKKLNLMLLAHPSSCFLHTEYQYSKSYNVLNLILLAENIYSISCFLQWASLSGQTREGYAAEQNVRLCICYLGWCIFYLAKWICYLVVGLIIRANKCEKHAPEHDMMTIIL